MGEWGGMFTGIIEEMGVVKEVIKTRQGSNVSILAKTVLEGLRVEDMRSGPSAPVSWRRTRSSS